MGDTMRKTGAMPKHLPKKPARSTRTPRAPSGSRDAIDRTSPDVETGRLVSFPAVRSLWQRIPEPDTRPHVAIAARIRQTERIGFWLAAQAHRSCAWDGAVANDETIAARVAARTGLPPGLTATALANASLDRLPDVSCQHLTILVDTILGQRERAVFLARCLVPQGAAVPVEKLADSLGIPPERVRALEASARRKIATAVRPDRDQACEEDARYSAITRWNRSS